MMVGLGEFAGVGTLELFVRLYCFQDLIEAFLNCAWYFTALNNYEMIKGKERRKR